MLVRDYLTESKDCLVEIASLASLLLLLSCFPGLRFIFTFINIYIFIYILISTFKDYAWAPASSGSTESTEAFTF